MERMWLTYTLPQRNCYRYNDALEKKEQKQQTNKQSIRSCSK